MGLIVLSRRAQRGSRALIHRSRRNRDAPLCTVCRGIDGDAKESLAGLRIAEDETWSSSKASKFETTPASRASSAALAKLKLRTLTDMPPGRSLVVADDSALESSFIVIPYL